MRKHKCDILDLEWVSNGRDTHIVEPVLVSLEERFGYSVIRSSIWSALFKILWYRPKVLFMANAIGAENNATAFHFAHNLGITTITLISEGLHHISKNDEQEKKTTEQMFWGDNFSREMYWDLMLIWSELLYNDFKKWIPKEYLTNVRVCGGSGFDRYTILPGIDKDALRNRLGIKTEKIALLIGFGFDKMHQIINKGGDSDGEFEKIYKQMNPLRDIYRETVERNRDVTFILKYHPGTIDKTDYEFFGLEDLPNTISLKNEIEISNLISLSDVLVCFESTTALEAWLLKKTTVFVNPLGTDFLRQDMYKGSIVVENADQLNRVLRNIFSYENIPEYSEKEIHRKRIIKDNIYSDDGFNYLRNSKTISEFLISSSKKVRAHNIGLAGQIIRELMYESIVYIIEKTPLGYLKKNNKIHYMRRRKLYDKREREEVTAKYRNAVMRYEIKNSDKVQDILLNF